MQERCFPPFENKVWLSSPTMHGEEMRYMQEAYATNWMSTVGENIYEVERLAAEQTGAQYAVALSSGTAALHLAVRLAMQRVGAKREDSIFCSDMTFSATANPIVYEGGVPVFIDTERDTWNMDPAALERAFSLYPESKIVVFAHLYGTPAKMDEITEICHRHGAVIVEDAAESLGAAYQVKSAESLRAKESGNRVEIAETSVLGSADKISASCESGCEWRQTGSFGTYNVISFNGNKIITGSAGGCLVTDDREAADRARKWSTQSRDNAPWYQHTELGYNYRMSNVVAGVVRGQFPYLHEHIAQKQAIYERYRDAFQRAGLPVQMNPSDAKRSVPNYWLSCITVNPEAMCSQERSDCEASYVPEHGKSCPTEILEALAKCNAEARPIWKPMHLQPLYRENAFVTREGAACEKAVKCGNSAVRTGITAISEEEKRGNVDSKMRLGENESVLDVGSDIFARGLCLPSDNKMTEAEQDRVIEIVKSCFE